MKFINRSKVVDRNGVHCLAERAERTPDGFDQTAMRVVLGNTILIFHDPASETSDEICSLRYHAKADGEKRHRAGCAKQCIIIDVSPEVVPQKLGALGVEIIPSGII